MRVVSSKVCLQAVVAKVRKMTSMGCLECHANDFVPGKNMNYISQRIPNRMASILGLCKRVSSP